MRTEPGHYTRCRIGVAVRDITPPVGIYHRSWGAATHDVAEGVHRPCFATAAVFRPLDDDGPTLALVALDFGWFQDPADEAALRARVRERTGLGEAELLVNLSHTHASANATRALADRPGGHLIAPYHDRLADTVAAAVEEARSAAVPGWITWGTGRCALARNRDYRDEAANAWACGYNPAAPADDTVLVGRATADDGRPLAILVNYACHPTTLAWANRLLSPDFIGGVRDVLEPAFGAPLLFLQGASGELGPREVYVRDTTVADRNGWQLGYAVAAALEALPPPGTTFEYTGIVDSGAQLGTWAYRPTTAAELGDAEWLAAHIQRVELERKPMDAPPAIEQQLAGASGAERERLTRRLLISRALGSAATYSMPLWCWALGAARLVAVPNEAYSRLQVELRARFPDRPVLVLGVTHGSLGYLSRADTYGGGRYQEWQSPFAPGCLEATIEAAAAGLAAFDAGSMETGPAGMR